jgi:hypothetical protein
MRIVGDVKPGTRFGKLHSPVEGSYLTLTLPYVIDGLIDNSFNTLFPPPKKTKSPRNDQEIYE